MAHAVAEASAASAHGHEPTDAWAYGMVAEFDSPESLLEAAGAVYKAGYRRLDGFSPMPIEGLSEALGQKDEWVPRIMLTGGICGCLGGFGFLTWTTVFAYPVNIGGRPLFAPPSWIPITFEFTVLLAALSGIAGMFILNGLPAPYHPVFEAKNFAKATSDGFFLSIEASDPRYDRDATRKFLEGLHPISVSEVQERR